MANHKNIIGIQLTVDFACLDVIQVCLHNFGLILLLFEDKCCPDVMVQELWENCARKMYHIEIVKLIEH